MSQEEKLLRADQVARRLGLTDQHVRWLVRHGRLPSESLTERGIRIPEGGLEGFKVNLEQQRKGRIKKYTKPPQTALFEPQKL